MNDALTTVAQLKAAVATFVQQREWGTFHSPKNLAMSIAIEAAELMEHFQWLDVAESRQVPLRPADKAAVGEEMADVLAYTLALANAMEIDLAEAFAAKMIKNQEKYPAAEFQGRWQKPAAATTASSPAAADATHAAKPGTPPAANSPTQ